MPIQKRHADSFATFAIRPFPEQANLSKTSARTHAKAQLAKVGLILLAFFYYSIIKFKQFTIKTQDVPLTCKSVPNICQNGGMCKDNGRDNKGDDNKDDERDEISPWIGFKCSCAKRYSGELCEQSNYSNLHLTQDKKKY